MRLNQVRHQRYRLGIRTFRHALAAFDFVLGKIVYSFMPFSSQFALSLEVTRLVPVPLVVNKVYEAIMNLARDLQNSGSNIVIEQDLADVFGRSKISTKI